MYVLPFWRNKDIYIAKCKMYLDTFAIYDNCSHSKVDADCTAMSLDECAAHKPLNHARFANASVTDQNQLEQVIKRLFL